MKEQLLVAILIALAMTWAFAQDLIVFDDSPYIGGKIEYDDSTDEIWMDDKDPEELYYGDATYKLEAATTTEWPGRFLSKAGVELGFRSDGVVVWREVESEEDS